MLRGIYFGKLILLGIDHRRGSIDNIKASSEVPYPIRICRTVAEEGGSGMLGQTTLEL